MHIILKMSCINNDIFSITQQWVCWVYTDGLVQGCSNSIDVVTAVLR